VAELLALIRPSLATAAEGPAERVGLFEHVGGRAFDALAEARDALGLLVDTVYWSLLAPARGRGFRWAALLDELHEMGVHAIGIVALLNFLLGVIIALLSAQQVRDFGLTIYVADLVVVAFARELAAIMTGIIVSARTGAAITAELATMKVQEEIDALRTMGLNTAKFLIAPKLWALLLALPALTVVGMVAGHAGGVLIGIGLLGEAPVRWWNEMVAAATMSDILQGIGKSLIFAVIIALIGCHNGLRVLGGARGVGLATTRSVVMDVFLIIAADMIFASAAFFV
jgi:phospholipid/cholesterol/gamma-HCH transport system permease protein